MSAEVSKVAAFVMENGSIAEQVLFGEDELPGLTSEEQNAIDKVQSHLEETWVALLSTFRTSLWALLDGEGHPFAITAKMTKNRSTTIWAKKQVEMPLVVNSSWETSCGATLGVPDGLDEFRLYVWCWTQAKHRQVARDSVQGLKDVHWDGEWHWKDLGVPKEGETYAQIGDRAAGALWEFAKPIAEAVYSPKESA